MPIQSPAGLDDAIRGFVEIGQTMFGIDVVPTGPVLRFGADAITRGATLSLLRRGGTSELGLFGDDDATDGFTRAMLAMEPEETPGLDAVKDALGEAVNMVAGIVKRKLPADGGELQLGVPLFLLSAADCRKFVPRQIQLFGREVASTAFSGRMFLVWSERTPVAVAGEVGAFLVGDAAHDKQSLAQVIALLQELGESLPSDLADTMGKSVEDCTTLSLGVINDEIVEASLAIDWVGSTIASLATALREGRAKAFIPREPPKVSAPGAAKVEAVQRDQETLESIGEFLQESEEGLDGCDRLLLVFEQGGGDKDGINALFRAFHSIKGVSAFLDMTEVTKLAHVTETLLAKAREGALPLAGGALDLVFESVEMMRGMLDGVRKAAEASEAFAPTAGLAEQLAMLDAAIRGEAVSVKRQKNAGGAQAGAQDAAQKKLKESVKLDVELVERIATASDRLVKTSAVLAAAEAILAADPASAGLAAALKDLREITGSLKESSALMRMVSVSAMFQKMTRMVRDLAKKTGKLARLVLEGDDTKMARAMVEKLSDPLVHMVRNAVDHGVEDEASRRTTGKPLLGTVKLSAYHEDKMVVIELSDDGRGLDPAKLVAKAKSKGLVPPDAVLADKEAFDLIFAAGFSTAEQVTEISGRGVGMDVVKRNIQSLGGRIEISSTVGAGSVFKLILPLVQS